jgi:hypothetical protein
MLGSEYIGEAVIAPGCEQLYILAASSEINDKNIRGRR